MQEERRLARGADGEAVIDPARMISDGIPPGRTVQIARLLRHLHAGHTERLEDEAAKRGPQLLSCRLLDETAHEEVADIRIRPAMAGGEDEAVHGDPAEQILAAPRRLSALYGLAIFGEIAIVRHPRRVLEELAQRVGSGAEVCVESEATLRHEDQRSRGQRGLRQAPPRHRGREARVIAERPAFHQRGEDARGIHPC
jgi:hypothetical protein